MPSIVIADDDPVYDEDLETILGFRSSYDVQIAHTGSKALKLIDELGKPDAIVLDMMLPWDEEDNSGGLPPDDPSQLRGLRVLQDLKDIKYDLRRVVVITAFSHPEAKRLLLESGIDEKNILVKPARTTEILARVRAACAVREN
ncbi:MAG: response regulator transcription factor [Planctomycetota bacterium]|jgi:CheY-like chemotaxis protein